MHKLLIESQVTSDRNLWLVTPDTWGKGLNVVWLVMGHPDKVGGTITIPIEGDEIPKLIEALSNVLEAK